MEATCGACHFPIYVEKPGVTVTCPACGFRGIASYDRSSKEWLLGLLGAAVVIGLTVAKENKGAGNQD